MVHHHNINNNNNTRVNSPGKWSLQTPVPDPRPSSCEPTVGYRLSFSSLNSPSCRSPRNYDDHRYPPSSARSDRSERISSRRQVRSSTPIVSLTLRDEPPVMLLPKVETRFMPHWESRSTVISTDVRSYLGLSHTEDYASESLKEQAFCGMRRTVLNALTCILASYEEGYRFVTNKDIQYLDSYGEIKDLKDPRRCKSATPSRDLSEEFYQRLLRRLGVVVDMRCQECARVVRKFDGCRGFFLWFLKQFDQRKEYDLAQKTDTLLHNVEPHFCNFVKKIELKPRRPTGVPAVREAFGTSDGEDDLDGLESASTTSSLTDRRGVQARPSTPHKTGYSRRCARPRTVRPRSATMAKKKKPTGGKAKAKPKPTADDSQWAEKVFNLDAPEKKPSKSSAPAPNPPAKKKKEVTMKADESPRRVVKKELTEKEEEQKPVVEMVETPPSPVPEPVVTIEGPPVPSEAPRPPPSPSLVDRRGSTRSPRPRGQPPDISQNKESGDGDQESRTNMKQTVDTSMSDAALKKFVQSSSHAASHAGRLALSKQSSRFELPMDMMSLETLTPQEYLREYCVVSSRRQSLYHKMFIKNKEPKKQTLQVKELVKALKDVLTDTLDDAMVSRVLDMTDVTEETQVDIKLFAGLAALSERMLYSKFVTEDTEGLQDHQKERIECADFFALDWKFHGVRVNEPMERLLRSL